METIPKRKVPDQGTSQIKNHSYSKTRLLDNHDSADNVTKSGYYSDHVIASSRTL